MHVLVIVLPAMTWVMTVVSMPSGLSGGRVLVITEVLAALVGATVGAIVVAAEAGAAAASDDETTVLAEFCAAKTTAEPFPVMVNIAV